MIKFIITIFIFLYWTTITFSQSQATESKYVNLVSNSSFEQLDTFNKKVTVKNVDTIEKFLNWTSPTQNKALVHSSDEQGHIIDLVSPGERNFNAKTGRNVATIKVFGTKYNNETGYGDEDRSYISTQLKQPLTIGQKYYAGFFIHFHCLGANRVGLALSKNYAKKKLGVLRLKPIFYQKIVIDHNPKNIWSIVIDSFIADSNYKFLVIGNFVRNDSTQTGGDRRGGHYLAYIDDVFVYEAKKNNTILLPQYFSNIQFEYNSYVIRPISYIIVDSISTLMKQNPNIKITIKGHTSLEGKPDYNKTLSQFRADAIKKYLIEKGINQDRIETIGLGSTQPLVKELSEFDKQTNRRIEFQITN